MSYTEKRESFSFQYIDGKMTINGKEVENPTKKFWTLAGMYGGLALLALTLFGVGLGASAFIGLAVVAVLMVGFATGALALIIPVSFMIMRLVFSKVGLTIIGILLLLNWLL